MPARAIMLQGTGSDVGKSLIAAGLCRAFANRGMKVAPFKPQNMSNNAAVTVDGGEIGRAQALQARAARVAPSVDMNPVLLKPETSTGAQVIVQGRRRTTLPARSYLKAREQLLPDVLASFSKLSAQNDIVIVEGAGSPAEINLRDGDIANMGFAHAAGVPAVLVADIHRGGVIASIVGTFEVISHQDAELLKGTVINNFHGDVSLFSAGIHEIERRTRRPCLGVITHFPDAIKLPAEDAVALDRQTRDTSGRIKVAVPQFRRIANFDDLDPLRLETDIAVEIVPAGRALPGDAALVILPGSKSTVADLEHFRQEGWDIDLAAHVRRGGHVLGLCGGFQMLGRMIHDPDGLEGPSGSYEGLGLLDIETTLTPQKTLTTISARHVHTGTEFDGYEIHLGQTRGTDCNRPFALLGETPDGARSPNGRIEGTYLHGCFASDKFRTAYLSTLGISAGELRFDDEIDSTLDRLASHLAETMDLDAFLALAQPVTPP